MPYGRGFIGTAGKAGDQCAVGRRAGDDQPDILIRRAAVCVDTGDGHFRAAPHLFTDRREFSGHGSGGRVESLGMQWRNTNCDEQTTCNEAIGQNAHHTPLNGRNRPNAREFTASENIPSL